MADSPRALTGRDSFPTSLWMGAEQENKRQLTLSHREFENSKVGGMKYGFKLSVYTSNPASLLGRTSCFLAEGPNIPAEGDNDSGQKNSCGKGSRVVSPSLPSNWIRLRVDFN